MLDNNGLSDEHETPLQSDMVTWPGSFSRGDTWEISNKSVFSFQLQFSLNSTWCVCGVLIFYSGTIAQYWKIFFINLLSTMNFYEETQPSILIQFIYE